MCEYVRACVHAFRCFCCPCYVGDFRLDRMKLKLEDRYGSLKLVLQERIAGVHVGVEGRLRARQNIEVQSPGRTTEEVDTKPGKDMEEGLDRESVSLAGYEPELIVPPKLLAQESDPSKIAVLTLGNDTGPSPPGSTTGTVSRMSFLSVFGFGRKSFQSQAQSPDTSVISTDDIETSLSSCVGSATIEQSSLSAICQVESSPPPISEQPGSTPDGKPAIVPMLEGQEALAEPVKGPQQKSNSPTVILPDILLQQEDYESLPDPAPGQRSERRSSSNERACDGPPVILPDILPQQEDYESLPDPAPVQRSERQSLSNEHASDSPPVNLPDILPQQEDYESLPDPAPSQRSERRSSSNERACDGPPVNLPDILPQQEDYESLPDPAPSQRSERQTSSNEHASASPPVNLPDILPQQEDYESLPDPAPGQRSEKQSLSTEHACDSPPVNLPDILPPQEDYECLPDPVTSQESKRQSSSNEHACHAPHLPLVGQCQTEKSQSVAAISTMSSNDELYEDLARGNKPTPLAIESPESCSREVEQPPRENNLRKGRKERLKMGTFKRLVALAKPTSESKRDQCAPLATLPDVSPQEEDYELLPDPARGQASKINSSSNDNACQSPQFMPTEQYPSERSQSIATISVTTSNDEVYEDLPARKTAPLLPQDSPASGRRKMELTTSESSLQTAGIEQNYIPHYRRFGSSLLRSFSSSFSPLMSKSSHSVSTVLSESRDDALTSCKASPLSARIKQDLPALPPRCASPASLSPVPTRHPPSAMSSPSEKADYANRNMPDDDDIYSACQALSTGNLTDNAGSAMQSQVGDNDEDDDVYGVISPVMSSKEVSMTRTISLGQVSSVHPASLASVASGAEQANTRTDVSNVVTAMSFDGDDDMTSTATMTLLKKNRMPFMVTSPTIKRSANDRPHTRGMAPPPLPDCIPEVVSERRHSTMSTGSNIYGNSEDNTSLCQLRVISRDENESTMPAMYVPDTLSVDDPEESVYEVDQVAVQTVLAKKSPGLPGNTPSLAVNNPSQAVRSAHSSPTQLQTSWAGSASMGVRPPPHLPSHSKRQNPPPPPVLDRFDSPVDALPATGTSGNNSPADDCDGIYETPFSKR